MNSRKGKFKIAIVGLGAAGSVIVRFLQRDKEIKRIICFVRNPQKAKEFLPDGFKKVVFKKLNLVKERKKFIKNVRGVNLVINAASSKINLGILDAAYKTGVNYLDLASQHLHNSFKAEQFEFNQKFKKKGLKGLMCAGAAPGLSNLLIAKLASKFNSIENIKLRLAEQMISSDIISSWSPEMAIEELSEKIPVLKNNRFILKPPFSEEEIYDYPLPFGKISATLICQDEQLTIPLFIKTQNIDVKSGGNDIETMKLFYRLGFFSGKSRKFGKVKIRPKDILIKILPATPSPKEMVSIIEKGRIKDARFGIVVEITGKRNNRKLTKKEWLICPSIFEIQKKMPGATYISYPTGRAAYLFSKALLMEADFTGVLPPEGLNPKIRSEILKNFKKIIGRHE
jgi:saccharopine dehydrogenase (NAD+, L-lysine-forming)